jgi:epoxyqueuosine reductase
MKDGVFLDSIFKYRTVSVEHLGELQEDIDVLLRDGKLSDNETFRGYIEHMGFSLPESFTDAKSIIVLALFTPLALADFHYNGIRHEIMIPPQYYATGRKMEQVEKTIHEKIIGESGYRIELSREVFLKRLAVRSGLGKYGRNNICYVDEMGSMITLYAFFTDFVFENDDWTETQMLDECDNCTHCLKKCPQGAIREDSFVIDVAKCVTLYNEIDGEFPEWILSDTHNALYGCMRCQKKCPGNRESITKTRRLDDITEEETEALLSGSIEDKRILQSVSEKLGCFTPENAKDVLPSLSRNLRALIT